MPILPDFLAALDSAKRFIKRNLQDTAENPSLAAERAADNLNLDLSNKRNVIRGGELKTENLTDKEIVDKYVSNFTGAGVIRPAGASRLLAVHNLTGSYETLDNILQNRKSLSNLSVAITKDNVFPFQQGPTLVFNPTSPLLDPAKNPTNRLLNRDFYTTRDKTPLSPDVRLKSSDLRFTEGGEPDTAAHVASIIASPEFKSFKEFERSSFGAKILTDKPIANEEIENISEPIGDLYRNWLRENTSGASTSIRSVENFQKLRTAALDGDTDALSIMMQLRSIPSNYAEMKVVGELPVGPRDVTAFMVPEYWKGLIDNDKVERTLNIRSGSPSELLPAKYEDLYSDLFITSSDYLRQNASKIEEQLQKGKDSNTVAKSLPKSITDYIEPSFMDDILNDTVFGNLKDSQVTHAMRNSRQFAADVAEILTRQDSEK